MSFAVERCENGAAHQGRAAQAGQNRSGKPVRRYAAAVDHAAGTAVDGQRRFVAEVDRVRFVPQPVRSAPALVQVAVPNFRTRGRVWLPISSRSRRKYAKLSVSRSTMPCGFQAVNDPATNANAGCPTPVSRPPEPLWRRQHVAGMWPQYGTSPGPKPYIYSVRRGRSPDRLWTSRKGAPQRIFLEFGVDSKRGADLYTRPTTCRPPKGLVGASPKHLTDMVILASEVDRKP